MDLTASDGEEVLAEDPTSHQALISHKCAI